MSVESSVGNRDRGSKRKSPGDGADEYKDPEDTRRARDCNQKRLKTSAAIDSCIVGQFQSSGGRGDVKASATTRRALDPVQAFVQELLTRGVRAVSEPRNIVSESTLVEQDKEFKTNFALTGSGVDAACTSSTASTSSTSSTSSTLIPLITLGASTASGSSSCQVGASHEYKQIVQQFPEGRAHSVVFVRRQGNEQRLVEWAKWAAEADRIDTQLGFGDEWVPEADARAVVKWAGCVPVSPVSEMDVSFYLIDHVIPTVAELVDPGLGAGALWETLFPPGVHP
jgi:hypothetical protein